MSVQQKSSRVILSQKVSVKNNVETSDRKQIWKNSSKSLFISFIYTFFQLASKRVLSGLKCSPKSMAAL